MKNNFTHEKKQKIQNKFQSQLKTVYPFIKGIPSSSNWSNHFTSLIFPGGKYLIYISNSFIIVLDLVKKKFSQTLSSYKISQKDKPNILLLINNEKFLSVLSSGEIIVFKLNNDGNFYEDLNSNKLSKIFQNTKCGIFDNQQNILILSNENTITSYIFQYGDTYNLYKIYEIDNINNKEYFITDMILIEIESFTYLSVSNNIGNIIIYKYDLTKYVQLLLINNHKKENIYNIIYDKYKNLLFSINKSGTLDIYQLTMDKNMNLGNSKIISLTNKFNDQTINEFYLYFSISLINNSSNILVTSNNGRIFIYNYEHNDFKEVAENPHKNSIYTILINKVINQIIFFSSDYKISLFEIKNEDETKVSINFMTCVNAIPSKIKLLKQFFNKIYFLYQIQHQLYLNSYDIKKEKNTLDTLQTEIRLKHKSKSNNNFNKENSPYNYNLILCKLINEEKILLINKNNEIIIYNINNKKIEKYKISNLIDKGNLLYIQDNIIIITIKESKTEVIQFHLLKNYICIKLKEIIGLNSFYSYQYLFSTFHFFYFYAYEDNLKIFYINIKNQFDLLKEKHNKEINYEAYLNIMNNLKNSLMNLNEKYYEFYSIFQRSDINKNIFIITNIVVNENFNMICSFSDGSIMYYLIDVDMKTQNNYIINKIIYKYLIKVNFLSINEILFINKISDNNENNDYFAATSSEQSLKIIDPSNCNILNINFKPDSNPKINKTINNNIFINKSFTNLFSNIFFNQPIKEAKKFIENFCLTENINESSIEVLIYSYFNNDNAKNFASIQKIIEYAHNKIKIKKQSTPYIEEICDFFSKVGSTNDKLIFQTEKDDDVIINTLIDFYCYVECLIYVKYKNLGLDKFIQCLEKIKKSIYIKQLFQANKIEKIIEYYKKNFNIT